jgi:hypothetical protein
MSDYTKAMPTRLSSCFVASVLEWLYLFVLFLYEIILLRITK